MSEEFSFSQVAEHATKKDLYVVIDGKVYNVSSFVDEHPGGEEVLLDVAGQEATEAFEDVGHSDEARGILDGMLIGTLKREEGDSKKQGSTDRVNAGPGSKGQGAGPDTSSGIALYAIIMVGGLLAFGAYQYFGKQDTK